LKVSLTKKGYQSRVYQLLEAATVDENISPKGEISLPETHAHRLMESASVIENLLPVGNIPEAERHAREIANGARLFENATPETEAQVQRVGLSSRALTE
jgi:endonuclease V-like protein UPF0215 family